MLLRKGALGVCEEKSEKNVLKSILNGQIKNCHYLRVNNMKFNFEKVAAFIAGFVASAWIAMSIYMIFYN